MKKETLFMKNNKKFLFAILSLLSISSLVACSGGSHSYDDDDEPFEEPVYEVGDTVIEWKTEQDYGRIPMDALSDFTGTREINREFGNEDDQSLYYELNGGSTYLSTDLVKDPYFTNDYAKNGDIVSLYFYLPADSNIESVQLSLMHGNNNSINGDSIVITAEKEEKWIRTAAVFDTLDILSAIRFNYMVLDTTKPAKFYIDDINITFGEETQQTGYEYKDESLKKAFADYFTVGNIMSSNMYNNTMMRQIIKDNFNSLTAENEAKPDSTLDQAACQELAKVDETAVAIKTSGFEKIYDWAEAHHIPVRHHTFVWHQQTPGWFFNEGYASNGKQVGREVMIGRLNNFIKTTIETLDERWPGLVYALDIVNEAIEEVGQMRRGNWQNTIGDDYIYQAFLAANQYKMDYQDVYYNDYAFEQTQWGGVDRCRWAVSDLLKKAIDEELIDGIGIQGHIEFSDVDTILEDARIIASAGIKCQITELDINCDGQSQFEQQKEAYKKVVKSVLEGNDDGTMNVNAIIVWGITDNTSWHSNRSPLMFDSSYAKKPAYYGFLEAVQEFEEEMM